MRPDPEPERPDTIRYPLAERPEAGATLEVASGVRWPRLPLPFQLNHINVWLLRDKDGWTVVDTGLFNATVQAVEEAIINAMVAAETMEGINGNKAYGLPHDLLRETLRKYNRLRE